MPKYENGVIYKLKHNEDYDDTNIYIGSTCNFKHRKNDHKINCNDVNYKCHNYPVYKFIRDNDGWDEWVMIAIEEYPCDSKKKLETRERYHIDLLRPTLNKNIPTRTYKEWCENNKEKGKEYSKKYREGNKEKISKHKKEYYKDNKEILNEKKKEYYENNKEKLLEKQKEYYQNNKEKLKEKEICDHCGCEITKIYLKKHQRTNKCINFKKD